MQQRGIYIVGESMRHLMNCSTEEDYVDNVSNLRESLRSRGYPEMFFFPPVPYDAAKRQRALQNLRGRNLTNRDRKRKPNILTLPVKYSHQQQSMGLASKATKLIEELRHDLGRDFCADTRVVVSNIVQRNAFTQTYRYNCIM